MDSNSPKQPEFIEQIESFISGLLRFVVSYFVTIKDFLFRPRRFGRKVSAPSEYTKPYSFLTLSSFSVATIARYSITCALLAFIDTFRGCSKATQLPVHYPPASDLLKIPKVEDVIYLALPTVLLVVVLAQCVSWSVTKRIHLNSAGPQITKLVIYASGAQFILLPIAAGLVYLATTHWKLGWVNSKHVTLWVVLFAAPVILWPAFSALKAVRTLEPPCHYRFSSHWIGGTLLVSACVFSLITSLVAGVGFSYLLARSEIEEAEKESPMISAAFLYMRPSGANSVDLAIVARNNSDTDLWIKADSIGAFGKLWNRSHISDKDIRGGVFQLPSGKDVVIPVEIGAIFEDEVVDAKTPSFVRSEAPLLFSAVDSNGNWQQLGIDPMTGQEVSPGQMEAILATMVSHLRPRENSADQH